LAALWRECDVQVRERYQQMAAIEKGKLQTTRSNIPIEEITLD
jgi:hypothetical protein